MSTNSIASSLAQSLLDISAVKLSPNKPFKWASGWNSPIYCDNRITLSYPEIRTLIKKNLSEQIKKQFPTVEKIAGVATAGIAHGALVADLLALPFIYVRSKPKAHGMGNAIEGEIKKGEKIVVIEDLISTGKSSLEAVKTLKDEGCEVLGLGAIFTYGFPTAENNFKDANCPYFTLSNYNILIEKAVEADYIQEKDVDSLNEWQKNPANWKV